MPDNTTIILEIVKNICFKTLLPSDPLISTKILDSINAVDLAVELENEFGISIPFVDINEQHFESVELIVNYVKLKQTN